MLPDASLSLTPIPGPFLPPDNIDPPDLEDWELGGVAIGDASEGLQYQVWHGYMDGDWITLEADEVAPTPILEVPGCSSFSFTFDQNMNVAVVYTVGADAYLYWYDTASSGYEVTQLTDAITPRVSLDDKRQTQTGTSDVILAYIRSNNLYFRAQRDRYEIEYLLASSVDAVIVQMGMSAQNRLQFKMRPIL